jgi:hypothetical protein
MTQKDSFFSDDDLMAVDQAFEQGVLIAGSGDSSVLPSDEEVVDCLVHDRAMSEAEARQCVHDTRHLMRSMGRLDTDKIDPSLLK